MYFNCAKKQKFCDGSSDEESSIDELSDDSENVNSDGFPVPVVTVSSDSESFDEGDFEDKFRKDLKKVLRNIHSKKTCEFAVGNISTELTTVPGIKISGYGPISLPVTDATITDLRKHFHQAPYGLGEATLIDKAVRDSWQLDPDKFEITNPQFNSGVKKLVREVQNELGCEELKVTSHLYKLLLYEPGGHFKPHRDTEKHPAMFATLLIQVPSIFTGGDLVVKHNSKEKRIQFGAKEAEFSCIYAAHYADCEHELTEITSGYRMALVYSLCWDGNGVEPSPPDIPTNELAALLKQHQEALPPPGMFAWGLTHHYSKRSLLEKGVQALKGGDKLIYSGLQGANFVLEEDKKLEFFIVEAKKVDNMYGTCTMEYRRRGYWGQTMLGEDCFDDDGDCETEYEFNVIGVDGKPWSGSLHFKLDVSEDVLNVGKDDDKFWGKCHEGECSGPSGNEGASKTNWYRRYVLVIFPKENAIKVVYKNSVKSAVEYLEQQLESEDPSSKRKLASDIVQLCVEKKDEFCGNEKCVMAMLKLMLIVKDLELAKKILLLLSEPIVSHYLSQSRYYWQSQGVQEKGAFGIPSEEMIFLLKDLISTFGWQALDEVLTKLISSCPSKYYKHVTVFLEKCPQDVPTEKLFASIVKQAVHVDSEGKESNLSDESLMAIALVIFKHPDSCSQFVKPFLDLSKSQNLQILNDILSLWGKDKSEDMDKDIFYQMTFAKFCEKIQNMLLNGVNVTSSQTIDAIVKGTEFLVNMQEITRFEKLVDDILQNPSANLLKKLLDSSLAQPADVSEPIKLLIHARIGQLLPIVRAGEPKLSWCQPEAVIPDHPEVQAFLRGPERRFVYKKFNARTRAVGFQRQYFTGRGMASVNVIGSRSNTVVEITKSLAIKEKHDTAMRKYNEDCGELKRLQAKLSPKSGL